MSVIYTPLSLPLIEYVNVIEAGIMPTSDSLNVNLTLSADFFGDQPKIIAANYGFDGYMAVPGLAGTDAAAQSVAYQYGVAWQLIDPALGAAARAYYSAAGDAGFQLIYGVAASLLDTIPVVFSHPVLGDTVKPEDFEVLLNTGEIVTPLTASFLPNVEFNERQTVVLSGDWGNRILPGEDGARYPVSVTIVDDGTPLRLVTEDGLVSAVGLTVQSKNPYVDGNGPQILAAKLDAYSDLGEGSPAWLTSSVSNSGADLFGEQAMYRLRIYTSAGFSPDGIASISPNDFSKFFQLLALDQEDQDVWLLESGVDYSLGEFGSIRIVGIADTGLAQESYDLSYVEDHDNQYDIILSGDQTAIARLQSIRMPSGDGYSPVYNPGGPGNDPSNNPPIRFTAPSSDQTVQISKDFLSPSFVSYIEVDGAVVKNSLTGQPIGAMMGLAVHDTNTLHDIYQFIDPDGKVFYSSFAVSPVYEIHLSDAVPTTHSRATNDQIYGSSQLNTVSFTGARAQYQITGNLEASTIIDLVPLRDSEDSLYIIDRLAFTNGTLAFDINGHAGQAFSMYQAALGRAPDTAGLGHWIDELDAGAGDVVWLARNFLYSGEFTETYGQAAAMSNLSFLDLLYDIAFERDPDADGLQYWMGQLAAGVERERVVASFSESFENQTNLQDSMAAGIWFI